MKIHRVVSEIWPWEFSLLHLKREVCLRIPEYAGVVWSGVVFFFFFFFLSEASIILIR